jgi:sortase A
VRNDETLAAVPVLSTRRLPETGAAVIAILGIALVSSLGVFMTSQLARGGSALGGEGGFVNLGDRRSVVGIVLLWLGIVVAGTALVVYQLGPLTQQRAQSGLFDEYRQELRTAKFAGEGLPGTVDAAAEVPPEIGAPVGILESNRLGLQEVVVEGMGPGQTAQAPGHVPGTAGLGQPGNAVVVGRRNAYGGPFRNLEDLRRGDRIVTATTQGQSVYVVRSVKERPYRQGLLRPTDDDRLTLVTSGSAQPRNAEQAVVVVAEMRDLPFAPTVQGARTGDQTSLSGQSSWSAILIAFVLYGAVLAGSVLAYRRFRFPIAYVLTIAPILAVTVVLGESLSTLLPSWS